MTRYLGFAYGVLAYLLFLLVFLYAVPFVGDLGVVPKTIDRSGPDASTAPALVVNLVLLGLFAVQHSVMARQWFKKRWTRIVPWPLERSTYVLVATAVLALLMWQWRPIPVVVWSVEHPVATGALEGVFWAGWALVFVTTLWIDHFALFGLKQVWRHLTGEEHEPPIFQTPGLYQYVRHPLYLGFLMAFWAAPTMTAGHLLFAAATTGYILVAIRFEERDLVRFHGEAYRRYRERVAMLIPWPRRTVDELETPTSSETAGPS